MEVKVNEAEIIRTRNAGTRRGQLTNMQLLKQDSTSEQDFEKTVLSDSEMDSRYEAVPTVIPAVVIEDEDANFGAGGSEDNVHNEAAGQGGSRRSSVFTITSAIKEFPDYIKRESKKVRGKECLFC